MGFIVLSSHTSCRCSFAESPLPQQFLPFFPFLLKWIFFFSVAQVVLKLVMILSPQPSKRFATSPSPLFVLCCCFVRTGSCGPSQPRALLPKMTLSVPEAHRVYYVELSWEAGLFHTAGSRGQVWLISAGAVFRL